MPGDDDDVVQRRWGSDNSSTSTATPPSLRIALSQHQQHPANSSSMDPLTAQLNLVDNLAGEDTPPPPAVIQLRKADVLIGRAADCQVTLSSLQISRRHCKLEYRDDKWFIRDMSTNGLTVAAQKAIKGQLHPLTHHDLVQLVPTGTLSYRFLELNKNTATAGTKRAQPITTLPTTSITIDSDDESLLSVDHDLDQFFDVPAIKRIKIGGGGDGKSNSSAQDKDKNEQQQRQNNSVQCLDNSSSPTVIPPQTGSKGRPSIIFSPSKRPPRGSLSPSLLDSQSQSQGSQGFCNNKKEKTNIDIDDLLIQKRQLEAENEMLKIERVIEREEFIQKHTTEVANFKSQFMDEQYKKISEILESEFSCCVCSGVFVEPTISPSCGHTYCNYCITEWLKRTPECPICRSPIPKTTAPKKHVEMGNYILRAYEMLGDEYKERRATQIKDRQDEKASASAAEVAQLHQQRAIQQQQQQLAMDMINQMHAVVNIGGGRRRRGGGGHTAAAAAAAVVAGLGPGAGPAPRRTTRNRRGNNAGADAAAAQGGLPGGNPHNNIGFNISPALGMDPRNARHPFFQMAGTGLGIPNFSPFNNNPNIPYVHTTNNRDVMMID